MDMKESLLVQNAVEALRGGTFDESDVLLLLIMLRDHASKGSPVREFGDFVAHRQRDRGVLLDFIRRVRAALIGTANETVPLPVWSVPQIHDAINDVLSLLGCDQIDAEVANQLCVCVISLLQDVEIEQPESHMSYLAISMSSHYIGLYGHGAVPAGHVFQFPLLLAENHGYETSLRLQRVDGMMRADAICHAFAVDGEFRVEFGPVLPRR